MPLISRKRLPWILGLLAVLAAALWWWRQPAPDAPAQPRAAAAPRPALTVSVAQPQTVQLPVLLSANGNVAAWQEAVVGAEVGGLRLAELRAGVGDVVRAGQVLAVFAAEGVQAEVAQARAALAEAQAQAADAQSNAERARSLQNTGALSAQQIHQYLTAAQTAQARVEAAQAALAVQQLRLKQTQVIAPVAGIVSSRTATVGAVAAPGAELFRLVQGGRLEWRAEVTASELSRIRPGVVARLQPATGPAVEGRVRLLGPTVDAQTRSALVYVDLPAMNPVSPSVRPGMFARGEFQLGRSQALVLPQRALVARDGFEYVFVLQGGDRVAELKVVTGRRVGEQVEIVSGLSPEVRVVVQGAGFLNDGDLVQVAQAPAGAAQPAAAAR